MDTAERFADQLRELRKARGLTQKQLADLAEGVSSSYIALLETGQRSPSVETVAALVTALRCSPEERETMFAARADDRETVRPSAAVIAPGDMAQAARAMTATSAELAELVRRTDAISDQVGNTWTGSAASAYAQTVSEWRLHAAGATLAINRMADALSVYASLLDDVDRTVAKRLK